MFEFRETIVFNGRKRETWHLLVQTKETCMDEHFVLKLFLADLRLPTVTYSHCLSLRFRRNDGTCLALVK